MASLLTLRFDEKPRKYIARIAPPLREEGGLGHMRKEICAFVSCVLLCLLDAGCMGIVPMSKRTNSPLGPTSNQIADFSFIRVGQTGRADVEQRLQALDTGLQSPQFFLGRWSSSRLGAFCFGAGLAGGSCADAKRVWTNSNLLVEFDDKGVVKNFEVFTDLHLVRRLGTVTGAQKPLDPSQSTELSVHDGHNGAAFSQAKIVLHSGSLEFVETAGRGTPLHFMIGAEKVKKVYSGGLPTAEPIYACVGIQFSENLKRVGGRPGGKTTYFRIRLPDLVALLNFISQSHTVPAANVSKPNA